MHSTFRCTFLISIRVECWEPSSIGHIPKQCNPTHVNNLRQLALFLLSGNLMEKIVYPQIIEFKYMSVGMTKVLGKKVR